MPIRINKFVAQATGLARRKVDQLISNGQISLNGKPARLGSLVTEQDKVALDHKLLQLDRRVVIMLNKPTGYVCSRAGQGSHTIYELLPRQYQTLKSIGRLDKDSSGLILLTNDGDLALQLTHPKYNKAKVYQIKLNKPLTPLDARLITQGIKLTDGPSRFILKPLNSNKSWEAILHEGRNRQIRRTFAALNYRVIELHRITFGPFRLNGLASGHYKQIDYNV